MAKKWFFKRKLWSLSKKFSLQDIMTTDVLIKTWVVIASIIVVFMIWRWWWAFATWAWQSVVRQVTIFASQQIWEPLDKDRYGNINVLIAWYAGDDNRGWLLTDTIMLASYNPELEAVTFLSIPRDFYVNFGDWHTGKINALYPNAYIASWNDHHYASKALADKVSEITWVDIPYYAVLDFSWFVTFVDALWWIDINVPERIHDTLYPWPNDSYITFSVAPWWQTFDGETALKYARSRMTTSDFSRALRQQLIIEAILQKATRLWNISTIVTLYENLDDVVKTNIAIKNLFWLGQYMDQERHYFSYVYTAECNRSVPDLMAPWCVLYFGERSQFWWMSVLLPQWSSARNLSYYSHTSDFAFWVIHNQWFLKEKAPIRVLNWIDTQQARALWYRVSGVATALALDLIQRWFTIERITNAPESVAVTKIIIPWDWRYPETIKTLAAFVDYKEVIADPEFWSWVTIILWLDYLDTM